MTRPAGGRWHTVQATNRANRNTRVEASDVIVATSGSSSGINGPA